MAGKHKFTKAYKGLDIQKADELNPIPGILGFLINGVRTVEVPNRNGYVYVRLRDNLSEVCQAFNDNVSPVYGLPVLMVRDSTNRTRYRILGRDLGRYQDWGTSSPYLPRHGAQHSFNPPNEGGDVTWIYSRQLMPLAVYPSGSYGSGNVLIYPHTFYRNNTWHYAGGTGTASFLTYKPTGTNSAKMVLLYIDDSDAPAYVAGVEFNESLTGTVQIFPYIPSMPITSGLPLAAIRLVTGTSVILWDNIYDLRPWIVGDSFIPTGSSGHIIANEGSNLPNQSILDFIGPGVHVQNGAGRTEVIVSGTSVALPDMEVAYGNGASIVSHPRFIFDDANDNLTIGSSNATGWGMVSAVGGDDTGNFPLINIYGYGATNTPTFETNYSRGLEATPTPIAAGDQFFAIDCYAFATGSSNTLIRGAYIEAYALSGWDTIGGNHSPSYLLFSVGSAAYSGVEPVARLESTKVDLSGDLNVTGTVRPGVLQLKYYTFSGSNPPTDAQLDAGVGTPASMGKGFTAYWDNNNAGTNVYLLSSDGTNWWHQAMTKAT